RTCYIYIRGEFTEGIRVLTQALDEAYAAGYVGKNILGTGVDVDVFLHSGAGSYECGEETALIESLEGKRGQPRVKPPFPAVSGLYNCPTVVNNVETLICVPLILERGPEWFVAQGTEKNSGPKLYCISGHVERPGVCEAVMGKTVCAFGDAAATPAQTILKKFREEYEYHVREKGCWRRVAKTFAEARARTGQPAEANR